jgi:hypothetical protein
MWWQTILAAVFIFMVHLAALTTYYNRHMTVVLRWVAFLVFGVHYAFGCGIYIVDSG